MTARYIVGDTRQVLATLEPASVDLVLTSPPFLALRSYLPADHPDKPLEIGSESTPGEFIDTLLDVVEACERVLAPHGSMCIELGDTYSGSGGAGGDYGDQGLRAGQPKFLGSNGRRNRPADVATGLLAPTKRPGPQGRDEMPGWPLDKSLCLIPEIFRFSLVYGFNPLTGRQTPRWRARNVIRWCRPNPPVGALGDKFRPATSEMVVICKSRTRYFDLDAVRTPHKADPANYTGNGYTKGNPSGAGEDNAMPGNPAGAPPLDWWKISTQPYEGSHYATYPEELCVTPIKAMCPLKVCRVCGEPSRRIVEHERTFEKIGPSAGRSEARNPKAGPMGADYEVNRTTLGWTDCGHGRVECGNCGRTIPHATRRSGETSGVSAGILASALSRHESEVSAEGMSGVRDGLLCTEDTADVQSEVRGTPSRGGGATELVPEEVGQVRQQQRLRDALHAGSSDGNWAQEDVGPGASVCDGGTSRSSADERRACSSSERSEGRQSPSESGAGDSQQSPRRGRVPSLPPHIQPELGTCPDCESSAFVYIEDNWRTGLVLDPFGGSGTTLAVATGHGRDAIGIDLDERNADLALQRVGPLLLTIEHPEAAA